MGARSALPNDKDQSLLPYRGARAEAGCRRWERGETSGVSKVVQNVQSD